MHEKAFRTIPLLFLAIGFLAAQSSSWDLRMEGKMPLTALEQPIDPSEYVVGPGDFFMVSINDVVPYIGLVVVTPTGEMIIPGVGAVHVGGLTLAKANRSVVERIRQMYPSLEAYCALYDLRKIRVSISGAIKRAGYYLTTPVSRVSDLITMAGRPLFSAGMNNVVIERLSGERLVCNMTRYYHAGDISQNPFLQGGDRVILPFADAESDGNGGMRPVMVMGEINSPGTFVFQPGLTIKYYLAMAGGPTTNSSMGSVRVVRADGRVLSELHDEVLAGDILEVRHSKRYRFLGDTAMLQIIFVVLNMYMAFLATQVVF